MRKIIPLGFLLGILLVVSACASKSLPTYAGEFACDYSSSDELVDFLRSESAGELETPLWAQDILDASVVKVGVDANDDGDPYWMGTGFLIAEDKVVTARHVVDTYLTSGIDQEELEFLREGLILENREGRTSRVSSVIWSEENDVAVLTISDPLLGSPLPTSDPYMLEEGEEVYTIGYSRGGFVIRGGMFIGVGCPFGPALPLLITNGRALPGNSGGPALNAEGEVIGVAVKAGWWVEPYWTAMVPINYAIELVASVNDEPPAPAEHWQGRRG